MAISSGIDEQLDRASQEDFERRKNLEELDNHLRMSVREQEEVEELERMYELESGDEDGSASQGGRTPMDRVQDIAKERIKQKSKRELEKKALQTGGKVAARAGVAAGTEAAAAGATATAPVWGTALAVILAIILLIGLVVGIAAAVVGTCNSDSWAGTAARVGSKVGSFLGFVPDDVCSFVQIDTANIAIPEPPGGTDPDSSTVPTDLVTLGSPFAVSAPDPRVRACMLIALEEVYRLAQAHNPPINFEITSAFRPGAIVAGTSRPSRHALGEAVDIVIIPRGSLSDPAFQRTIRDLVGIAQTAGFIPPAGDTLDEYNRPTEGATGGHIHLEFNASGNQGNYCDSNAAVLQP